MADVKVLVSHGTRRRGDRLTVDIHDPAVRGLIQAGYLKIIWKERGDDARELDSAVDPDGPGSVSAGGVDPGDTGAEAEEVADVPGEHQPDKEGPGSA
jgi:hypothetical protein